MRAVVIAALAAAICAAPASAQQAKMSADEKTKIRADVTATVNTYVREIFSGTPKGVVGTFHQPSFAISPGGVVANDPARQESNFEASRKRLNGEGWVSASFRPVTVCILNANAALAGMNLYRKKADGSEHLINSETILLARGQDGWKIVSLFVHEAADRYATCPE